MRLGVYVRLVADGVGEVGLGAVAENCAAVAEELPGIRISTLAYLNTVPHCRYSNARLSGALSGLRNHRPVARQHRIQFDPFNARTACIFKRFQRIFRFDGSGTRCSARSFPRISFFRSIASIVRSHPICKKLALRSAGLAVKDGKRRSECRKNHIKQHLSAL